MLAGKYAQLMQSPAAAMAVGGLGAAGASLLGNQNEDKSAGRQILEALGAGALGAGVGRMLPRVYAGSAKRADQAARNLANELGGNPTPDLNAYDRYASQNRAQQVAAARDRGVSEDVLKAAVELDLRGRQGLTNTAAVAGGLGLATGLGNVVGGGVANVGNMLGLSIDPEAPGSSNTQNSRLSMQTQQLPMY